MKTQYRFVLFATLFFGCGPDVTQLAGDSIVIDCRAPEWICEEAICCLRRACEDRCLPDLGAEACMRCRIEMAAGECRALTKACGD